MDRASGKIHRGYQRGGSEEGVASVARQESKREKKGLQSGGVFNNCKKSLRMSEGAYYLLKDLKNNLLLFCFCVFFKHKRKKGRKKRFYTNRLPWFSPPLLIEETTFPNKPCFENHPPRRPCFSPKNQPIVFQTPPPPDRVPQKFV